MEYSLFVTNVVKHVVIPNFEPILNKKIADVFEAVRTPKIPEKARKIKKIRRFVMNLRTGLSDWT